VVRLRRLWEEHVHRPFPATGDDPRVQEVALRDGTLDAEHAQMLKVRRAEGNQVLFRASGELGKPVRSYVARLIAIEDILSGLPVR
jgi:hypothetical protein